MSSLGEVIISDVSTKNYVHGGVLVLGMLVLHQKVYVEISQQTLLVISTRFPPNTCYHFQQLSQKLPAGIFEPVVDHWMNFQYQQDSNFQVNSRLSSVTDRVQFGKIGKYSNCKQQHLGQVIVQNYQTTRFRAVHSLVKFNKTTRVTITFSGPDLVP